MKLSSVTFAAALLAGSSEAFFGSSPPKPKVNLVDGFIWRYPWDQPVMSGFESTCEATSIFPALEYTLEELTAPAPKGLRPWVAGLKKFFSGREYPGGWGGFDYHLNDRSILLMDYAKVPIALREWIEQQERENGEGKGLFAVFEKPTHSEEEVDDIVQFSKASVGDRSKDKRRVVIFAPAAIHHVLPLWVAADSKCRDTMLDLSKYKADPADGYVIGWPEHKYPEETEMQFKVVAKVLKAKEGVEEEDPSSSESASPESTTKDEL